MEVCSQNMNDPRTVLLKVNGNRCNLSCEYCSELPKSFSKEQCMFDMKKIENILNRLPRDIAIIFHGGEPSLIGKENILQLALLIKKLGFSVLPSIQTNGFLGDDWVDFFGMYKDILRISVSIDGDKWCNAYRKNKNNDPIKVFNVVDEFLNKLDSKGIEFRCIATINNLSWDKGEMIINYFSKFEHLTFLRLNPCFDIDGNGIKAWAITPSQYLECLVHAFDRMVELGMYNKVKVDPFMDIISCLNVDDRKFDFKCNKFSSIFPDGTITSCDAMREIEQDVEICEEMFDEFIQPSYVDTCMKMCEGCEDLLLCRGGCPPLINRYKEFNPELIKDYCNYRVQIRKYILKVIKNE